jgi:glycosyltransferase involved in cell wall biosynthesis
MDVSIVIPTFDRFELLQQTVEPLLNQETNAKYEVIFVSNGSTDDSTEFLTALSLRFPEKLTFRWIPPTGGPSAPRNRGIRLSKGRVVIILDDDVLPHRDLVEQHWRHHLEHPEQEAAALGHVYVPERLRSDPMSLFHSFPYYEVEKQDRLDYLHFWTCNVSFKRDFMLRYGMFPEDMLYFEDVFVGSRLKQNGMWLRYLPSAGGEHLHKMKPSDVEKKGYFTGAWLYETSRVLNDEAFNRRFGIFDPRVGYSFLLWKAIKRAGFLLADNTITWALLKSIGGAGSKRSWASDCYNYLRFRRSWLVGYAEEMRQHRSGHPRLMARTASEQMATRANQPQEVRVG